MATSSKTATKTPAKAAVKPAAEAAVKATVAPAKAGAKAAAKAATKAATKEVAAGPVETATKKTAAPAKVGAKKKTANISPEQRNNYVQIAAYYVAERHGFTSGREAADWAEAEAEIDRLLGGGHFNP